MQLHIDSEFKNLIPPLTDDEYKQLEENVVKEGCRDSLVVWNGTIVDGHNRYEICNKHSIEFKTAEMEFETRDGAIEWIIRNQFGRRNLPNYERAKLALRLKPIIKEKAKTNQESTQLVGKGVQSKDMVNQKSDTPLKSITTDKELAKIAGVSHNTIWQVGVIENEGSEEVQSQARKGEISVNKAFNLTRPKVEPAEKTKICIVCEKEKTIQEFVKNDKECKECLSSRERLGLTRKKYREINESFPDEELEAMYQEMKRPPTPRVDSPNENQFRNSIVVEFEELVNDFQCKAKKYLYMPQVKDDEISVNLTKETIEILKNIIK